MPSGVCEWPRKRSTASTLQPGSKTSKSSTGPLLVTTNRTVPEVEAVYGEAVASRLSALCLVLEVRGDDERRRAA